MHESVLVIGGQKSGKSRYALDMADAVKKFRYFFVATCRPGDDGEMNARIAAHQAERQSRWQTIEAPVDPAAAILSHGDDQTALLIDCLTLWLFNLTENRAPSDFKTIAESAAQGLVQAVDRSSAKIFMVTNEIGLGVIADNPRTRAFGDAMGRMNQIVAAAARHVFFMAAGCALKIK